MSDAQGFLTKTDKEWLRGEKEYEHRQSAANKRAEVRERVSAALEDFELLNEYWSSDEHRKMLEEVDEPEDRAAEVIEFLYFLFNEPTSDATNVMDDEAVSRALRFRKSLWHGIKSGKKRIGDAPDLVCIDANTELFELPSKEEMQKELDTEQWRRANEYVRGAIDSSGDEVIDQEEAASQFHMALHLAIEERLYDRRMRAKTDIKRHDTPVAASGPKFKDKE